jgi:hypothetical protein
MNVFLKRIKASTSIVESRFIPLSSSVQPSQANTVKLIASLERVFGTRAEYDLLSKTRMKLHFNSVNPRKSIQASLDDVEERLCSAGWLRVDSEYHPNDKYLTLDLFRK